MLNSDEIHFTEKLSLQPFNVASAEETMKNVFIYSLPTITSVQWLINY